MNIEGLFVLLIWGTIFGWHVIRSASNALLAVGRSRKGSRKVKGIYSFKHKLLLKHVKEQSKMFLGHVRFLLVINKIYLLVFFTSLILIVLALFTEKVYIVAYYLVISKSVILDIPLIVYMFLMTEHDNIHGGVRWKYKK